jgi:hypothetical protein
VKIGTERRRIGLPGNKVRAYPTEISGGRVQTRPERPQELAAENPMGHVELAPHEKSQIIIETRPHVCELILVHLDGSMQVPDQKRQPPVALRQHPDNQIDELAPALIANGEHALDGLPEIVASIVRERAARGFLV